MNIFKRIFRIGQAEIHAAVEKMEDPIKMTEQGLRELREDLQEAVEAYAKVKALVIRTENEKNTCLKDADNYADKAVLVLEKAKSGALDIAKAEELAMEALRLKAKRTEDAQSLEAQAAAHQVSLQEMSKNIEVIKSNLAKWEKELKILRARAVVSKATQEVNKQIAHIDSNDTIAMLERMKDKVEYQEALGQAYGAMAAEQSDLSKELDQVVNDQTVVLNDELASLKQKLGINKLE
jgi:phage shock protein A